MNVQTQQPKRTMSQNTPITVIIDDCIEDDRWCISDLSSLEQMTRYTLASCDWHLGVYINLILTNDSEIQDLNHMHRGKNTPTNVLSFQAYDDESLKIFPKDHPIPLGDIIMSFDTLTQEAKESHKTFHNHFMHLFLHGLLHLLGYDHINEDDANQMENLETEILKHFNIPNPYEVLTHI